MAKGTGLSFGEAGVEQLANSPASARSAKSDQRPLLEVERRPRVRISEQSTTTTPTRSDRDRSESRHRERDENDDDAKSNQSSSSLTANTGRNSRASSSRITPTRLTSSPSPSTQPDERNSGYDDDEMTAIFGAERGNSRGRDYQSFDNGLKNTFAAGKGAAAEGGKTSSSAARNNPSDQIQPPPAEDERRGQGQVAPNAPERDHDPSEDSWWRYYVDNLGSVELDNKGSVARDHLALERTFLAWLRTSLSFASIGIAVTQLFRLNTTIIKNGGAEGASSLRQVGKPLGATFLAIAIVVLFVGFHRYFESQHWIIRGKFPASRASVAGVAFIAGALIVASLVVILAVAPHAFEK